jgi:hypothetical protein
MLSINRVLPVAFVVNQRPRDRRLLTRIRSSATDASGIDCTAIRQDEGHTREK